jgi:hypothetical protein
MKSILHSDDLRVAQHLQLNSIRVARVIAFVYTCGVVTRMYWKKLNINQYFIYTSPTA